MDTPLLTAGDFENPLLWDHVDRGVPIFKVHQGFYFNPSTQKFDLPVKVDEARLEKMLDILKAKAADGVWPRMTIGHQEPSKDQKSQPPVIGFINNPRIVLFGASQTPTLIGDRYFLRGTWSRQNPETGEEEGAKSFLYRSVEFYMKELADLAPGAIHPNQVDQITAVSLLRTDPKLDLGITLYSSSARHLLACYSMEFDAMADTMNIPADPTTPPANPAAPVTPEDLVHQEFKGHFTRCMAEDYPFLKQGHQEMQAKYGSLVQPGPLNMDLPGDADKKPAKEPETTKMSTTVTPAPVTAPTPPVQAQLSQTSVAALPDTVRLQIEQQQIVLARYEQNQNALLARLQAMETAAQAQVQATQAAERKTLIAKFEGDLKVMLSQGYDFDLAEHSAEAHAITDQTALAKFVIDRPALIHKLQGKYGRAPISTEPMNQIGGDTILPNSGLKLHKPDATIPTKTAPKSDIEGVIAFYEANKKTMTYDQAYNQYFIAKAAAANGAVTKTA